MHLAVEDQRIDHPAAVVDHGQFLDLQGHRLRVHLDDHGVHAAGSGAPIRAEVVGAFQAGFGARLHGAAQRIGFCRQFPQRHGLPGHALHPHLTVHQLEILLRHLHQFPGQLENLRPHILGRLVDRVAGHHRAPAGESPGAPMELIRVSSHDLNVGHVHSKLLGDDLGEASEMALPLGPYSGRHRNLPAGLHLNPGALIGPNPGAFDV